MLSVPFLPRLIRFVERFLKQQPIIKMLSRTSDVPDAMPTINNVPDNMLPAGVVLFVGEPPRDDAGGPVGGASVMRIGGVVAHFIEFCVNFGSNVIDGVVWKKVEENMEML